jgi:hypothetical protein
LISVLSVSNAVGQVDEDGLAVVDRGHVDAGTGGLFLSCLICLSMV